MDIKSEGIGLIKTLGAIGASLGVVWGYVEPIVEDYVHEQIKVVQEEDKRLIEDLKSTVDADFEYNRKKRNQIIEEIQFVYTGTRLKIEE